MTDDTIRPSLAELGSISPADCAAAGGSPSLRRLLESTAFVESESKLTIAMGEDCAGQPYLADLKRLPHLLVGGVPWSGKSTFLRAVITTLLFRCSPADLRLFLFSPDPLAFRACEGLPHLLAPPTSDAEAAAAFLDWAHYEMYRRYRVMAAAGVRNIDVFNRVQRPSTMPYLVAVLDGLGALAGQWHEELLTPATELCQMSRAIGIHMLMATGDLSVAALPGQLSLNVTARMSFRQARRIDSAVALGARGAEELTEAGEALFCPPTAITPVSLRGPWVTEEALQRVVAVWRDRFAAACGDVT